MTPYLSTDRATLWHARAEDVYPRLAAGSVSMVWSDGPYALKKAPWDMMGIDGLADWYAPHIEAWGRVCAPSATVYLWGTAEGWARIDPVMRAAGWRFAGLIIWDKGVAQVTNYHMRLDAYTEWPDVTEVCGCYQRPNRGDTDDSNEARAFIRAEIAAAQMTHDDIRKAIGVAPNSGMPGHYTGLSQWMLPTWAAFQALAAYANQHGPARARPYFVHPTAVGLEASLATLQASYEALRPPFALPANVSNVWHHALVGGRERLKLPDGETHPCQKPLLFAERAIRASTRIGDTILDPFAGTNRIALACRRLPEEERRHAIGIEMDRRWLDAVRPSLIADHGHTSHAKQPSLFGGGS